MFCCLAAFRLEPLQNGAKALLYKLPAGDCMSAQAENLYVGSLYRQVDILSFSRQLISIRQHAPQAPRHWS